MVSASTSNQGFSLLTSCFAKDDDEDHQVRIFGTQMNELAGYYLLLDQTSSASVGR